MLKIELFKDTVILAYLLVALSIVWLIISFVRFWQVNKVIKRMVIHKK